jgi:fructosamine-3-kinase
MFEFGISLAHLHSIKETTFAKLPVGNTLFFGPLKDPIEITMHETNDWKDYFVNFRINQLKHIGSGILSKDEIKKIDKLKDILDDIYPKGVLPTRIHGDLWAGNLVFEKNNNDIRVVMIDPAAHTGMRDEDLAMLELFSAPYYSSILKGYATVLPIGDNLRKRITLQNLFPVLAHAYLFGAGYLPQYKSLINQLI